MTCPGRSSPCPQHRCGLTARVLTWSAELCSSAVELRSSWLVTSPLLQRILGLEESSGRGPPASCVVDYPTTARSRSGARPNRPCPPTAGHTLIGMAPAQRDPKVVVLGGGSWGTTVASICARRGPTLQWVRSEETANDINEKHRNIEVPR